MTLQEKLEEWQREIMDIEDEMLDTLGQSLSLDHDITDIERNIYIEGYQDALGNVLTLLRNEKINLKI